MWCPRELTTEHLTEASLRLKEPLRGLVSLSLEEQLRGLASLRAEPNRGFVTQAASLQHGHMAGPLCSFDAARALGPLHGFFAHSGGVAWRLLSFMKHCSHTPAVSKTEVPT